MRTRRQLQEALFALVRERGIEHVSVGEIADRAGVNRSTFYQHYADTETLLADALDLVAERAYEDLKRGLAFTDDPPEALVGLLEHIEDHADLYRSVFSEPGWGVVLMRLRAHIRDAVIDVADRTDLVVPPGVPLNVVAASLAGSVVGVIGEWLLTDPRPSVSVASVWVWRVTKQE